MDGGEVTKGVVGEGVTEGSATGDFEISMYMAVEES